MRRNRVDLLEALDLMSIAARSAACGALIGVAIANVIITLRNIVRPAPARDRLADTFKLGYTVPVSAEQAEDPCCAWPDPKPEPEPEDPPRCPERCPACGAGCIVVDWSERRHFFHHCPNCPHP